MPEQKSNFMVELDMWSDANVIGPLFVVGPTNQDWEDTAAKVKKAIRAKVLESYRNGQSAGPQRSRAYGKR